MSEEGDRIRERLRIAFLEHTFSRGFFLGNGMYLVYHTKFEDMHISDDRGAVVSLDRVDIALLRRLLEAAGELIVPSDDQRYQRELAHIQKDQP